jgi:hypothetical protein
MPRGSWSLKLAIGGVTAAIFVAAAWFAFVRHDEAPMPGEAPLAAEIETPECGYVEANERAHEARAAERDPKNRRTPTRRRQVANEAQAAQSRAEDARQCEERARDIWDLRAQWHSAVAARNVVSMAKAQLNASLIEIILLVAAIVVGVVTVLETREAAEAQRTQAEKHFETTRRARLHASFVVFRVYRTYSGNFSAQGMCTITNIGGSAATNVSLHVEPITQAFGPKEDSELAAKIEVERSRPIQAGDILQPVPAPPLEKLQLFMPIDEDCYVTEPNVIGMFNVYGWVRYRFEGASRYHITPFVRSVGFTSKDGSAEFHIDSQGQGTTLGPD